MGVVAGDRRWTGTYDRWDGLHCLRRPTDRCAPQHPWYVSHPPWNVVFVAVMYVVFVRGDVANGVRDRRQRPAHRELLVVGEGR